MPRLSRHNPENRHKQQQQQRKNRTNQLAFLRWGDSLLSLQSLHSRRPRPSVSECAERAGAILQKFPSYTQIVTVKNQSSTQEDWPAYSPVGVCPVSDLPADKLPSIDGLIFTGCRLNDYGFDDGNGRILGITQEPIKYGDTGRVCVRGVTVAAVYMPPSGYTPLQAEWVQVRFDATSSQWNLLPNIGGDARLLQYIGCTWYSQTGYYSGSYAEGGTKLAWIDLCEVPNRRMRLYYGSSPSYEDLPPCSIVQTSPVATYGVSQIPTDGPFESYSPFSPKYRLFVSPQWTVPHQKYAYFYEADEDVPVCCRVGAFYSSVTDIFRWGPAPGKYTVWPGLPGFEAVYYSTYISSGVQELWVRKNLNLPFYVKASYNFRPTDFFEYHKAWIVAGKSSTGQSLVYDGSSHEGYSLPNTQTLVFFSGVKYSEETDATKCKHAHINIPAGRIFKCRLYVPSASMWDYPTNRFVCYFEGDDESVWDDLLGTIKMMDKSTSDIDIPPNWQIFMEGKFPVGYLSGDTDFGDSPPSPCGNKTHTHSSGSAFGAAGSGLAVAKHLPPYQIVKFIQRVPGIV